jgi:hypothetical protein
MTAQLDSDSRTGKKRRIFLAVFSLSLVAALVAGTLVSSIFKSATAATPGSEAVVAWNTIALRTSVKLAGQNQPQSQVYLARVQGAVYNAVMAIEGRYELYQSGLAPRPEASIDAAIAAAAYTMLVYHFPDQQNFLDNGYEAALAAIPDGPAKTAGVEVGQEAANELIALRQGDGLDADIGFVMPAPAPGVFQLPIGVDPLGAWISKMKPYLLESPDQFRPGPPPDLSSTEWAKQYREVYLFGSRNSRHRTAEQTDVASFWTTHAPEQYNLAFQQIAQERGLDAVEASRLFAMGNIIGADAIIACFVAKYHYLFWRHAPAIVLGEDDGNPQTTGDAAWLPFLGTPTHPEYPSAHSCLTGSMAEVFAAFLGTQQIELDLKSNAGDLMQPTRHYKFARDLVKEIVNARVWGGLHYRGSDVAGVTLGQEVARWALERYFLPTP